jgi:N-acetylmuramic acid 6-phosphate etherase
VHDGMMVNVRAENAKLRERAAGIVARITGINLAAAGEALRKADYEPKIAVLIAAGAVDVPEARRLLDEKKGHLRPALAWLGASPRKATTAAGAN